MITVCLILVGVLLGLGAVCYAHQKLTERAKSAEQQEVAEEEKSPSCDDVPADSPTVCCGAHAVCERTSLLADATKKPVYFDDEELDAFAGRDANTYTAAEADRFRDVLLTLLPQDVAPWARSIQQRGIALPPDVRDELILLVREQRAEAADAANN